MRDTKQNIAKFASVLFLPAMIGWLIVVLLRHAARFIRADLINFGSGGFGHTIEGPDSLRRLFPGRRVLMVFAWGKGRYNRYVSDLFSDIDVLVITLPANLRIFGFALPLPYKKAIDVVLHGALANILKRHWPQKFLDRFYCEYLPIDRKAQIKRSCLDDSAVQSLMWPEFRTSYYYRMGYLWIRSDRPMPRIRMNAPLRRQVDECIADFNRRNHLSFKAICCVYLRHRGSSGDTVSFVRSSSPIQQYELAMKWLIAQGYQILAVGDNPLPLEIQTKYAGAVIDNQALNLDRGLFMAYAATECDFFIGCPAGGSSIAGAADRPILVIDSFPYFATMPGASHYYKTVRQADGSPLPTELMFGKHLHDWKCEGYNISPATPEEISEAVQDFVQRLESGLPLGLPPDVLGDTFDDLYLKHTNSYVSPIWFNVVTAGRNP